MGSEHLQTSETQNSAQKRRMKGGSLDYGQLGEVSYDLENHCWKSVRSLDAAVPVTAHGSIDVYVPAQSSAAVVQRDDLKVPLELEDVRKLVKARPEFQPGLSIINNYLSEALMKPLHLTAHPGDLVVFGKAKSFSRDREKIQSCPVVAVPAGSHYDKLCILQVRHRPKRFGQVGQPFLWTLDLGNTVTGIWSGDGGPINQICVEPSGQRPYTLLAVRTSTSIHVLRPIIHPTYVHAEHLLVLQTPPQPNAKCVDFSFNHWTPNQLAAIDSRGQFVVWDLFLYYKCFKASTKVVGSMRRSHAVPKEGHFQIPDDGWRRLLSVGDRETLILSSRSHLECWKLSGEFLGDEDSIIEPQGFMSRIVDLRKNPVRDDEFFVVTTKSVIGLRVKLTPQHATFEKIMSWTHHRDVNDFSLRLSLFQGSQDLRVLLYSRNDSLCTVYPLTYPNESGLPVLQGAPYRCGWSGNSLLDIQFVHLLIEVRPDSLPHWSELVHHWQAIALASDLSLRGCLFHERPKTKEKVLPATWTAQKRYVAPQSTGSGSPGDSNISDGTEDLSDRDDDISRVANGHIHGGSHGARLAFEFSTTESNELILETLEQTAHEHKLDMAQFLNSLTGRRSVPVERESSTLSPIISLAAKPPKVGDLDTAFASAASIVQRFYSIEADGGNQPLFSPLASAAALGLSNLQLADESLGMDLLYRRLLSIYDRPLAPRIRVRARLNKEASARQVAGALFLASIGIGRSLPVAEDESLADARSNSQRATESAAISTILESDPLTHSVKRLSNYTNISTPPAIQPATTTPASDPVAEILAHWTLHGDPSQYSYRDTVAALTGESAVSGSQMSAETRQAIESQRRRAAALEEIRREREARRDAKRRRLDPRVSASQPDPGHAASPSTQSQTQTQTQDDSQTQRQDDTRQFERPRQPAGVVASQVEPGRHGGRSLLGLPQRDRDRDRRPRKKSGFN